MKSEFVLAINEIIEARALPREIILEALRTALVSAYRRDVSASSAQNIDVEFDMETGTATILVEKEIVEGVTNPRTEVEYDTARSLDPDAELGETMLVPVADTSRKFGRIAAQTAKQVILQKIREAEREALYDEYIQHEGDLISGTVQSAGPQGVTLSLGRAEAIMPPQHQMPGEHYRPRDKVRTFLLQVKKGNRGPQILVSRSHPNMLRRLLEYEVPEIYNGQVEIKNIAREAGHRSKVAVAALQEGVDPVGACVGMRGIRIQNIVRELNDEKIDVIEWNADPSGFITKALSPARVSGVYLDELADTGGRSSNGTATVLVPDDQLSLAIGREGQNARLAAKLTGWRIDIKSVTESAMEAIANTESAGLKKLNAANEDLVAEVQRIIAKRETNRPVMPEEFQVLTRYARLVEDVLVQERRTVSRQYQKELQAIRDKLPEGLFSLEIAALDLPEVMLRPLTSYFETVGELATYMEADISRVQRGLSRVRDEDALDQVRYAIENVEMPEPEVEAEAAEAEVEAVAEAVETAEEAEAVAEAVEQVEATEADELAMAEAQAEDEVLPA
ncbi:MAG: transcription termination/antitermination protein NusA, partial [Anaerolineae bacterium]|nr:transcription termination/antitermination protein NusA [Anaerolineae bacterium]